MSDEQQLQLNLNNDGVILVAMGVCGSGKSTIGKALCEMYNMPFIEGDEMHPRDNIVKMSMGEPLNDEDRVPWLHQIRDAAVRRVKMQTDKPHDNNTPNGVVVSCSSLKKYYRDILRGTGDAIPGSSHIPAYFVYIKGSQTTLECRMAAREGHYMKPGMLASQLEILESPEGEQGVVVVGLEDSTQKQLQDARVGLGKLWGSQLS